MTRIPLRILTALCLVALSLFVVACGGDDDEESAGGGAEKNGGTPAEGKQGGKLTQLGASDVDYNDPGHTYYTAGFQVVYATHKTLYSFKPGDTNPQPDLAEGEPEISPDKKTVTVKIKKGVKFSPPVDREVTSEDVKYAIERFFTENVGGQYPAYFDDLVGSPEKPGDFKEIPGIETPDPNTVVFKLQQATGVPFAAALVMPVTAPVPKEYAEKYDQKNPSTYNTHVVATGPYMIRNNAEGELVGYKAGKSIELVRNPNWNKSTDFRPAYLDEILLRTNASDATVSGRQVQQGQGLVLDTNPPAQVLKRTVQRFKDQLKTVPSGGFRYFPLNTTLEPFDDLNVRKAVLAGFDRDAARKARGGEFVGPIASHFIPPGINGHDEAGGLEGTGVDFLKNPKGDVALAGEYLKKAGFASGKYEGDEEILMIGATADPVKAQSQVAKAQLEKLGFKVKLRLVPQDAVYTEWCQVPSRKVHVCGGAGWFKDYNDPQAMLEPTFKGSEISLEGGNNNLGQLDVKAIDDAMDKAALAEGDDRNRQWGEVDKLIVEQAPAVPFVWDNTNLIHAKDVNGVASEYFTAFDLSFTSLK